MADCLYESDWHELSVDLQQKVVLMIQNMQRPLFYTGFGVAVLNLETFTKVSEMWFTRCAVHLIQFDDVMFWFPVHSNSFYLLHDVQDIGVRLISMIQRQMEGHKLNNVFEWLCTLRPFQV